MIRQVNLDTDEYRGLSSDTKPTNVGNGTTFLEIDTGAQYMYDAENSEWCLMPSGSGGGGGDNTEVISARTGADGTRYGSLKGRLDAENEDLNDKIDGEISLLKSQLGASEGLFEISRGALVANEYVKIENGAFLSYGGWSRTGYLDISNCSQIKIQFPSSPSDGSQYNAVYDENKNYISGLRLEANTLTDIPSGAKYIAISQTTDKMNTLVITVYGKGMGYVLQEEIDNVSRMVITEKTIVPDAVITDTVVLDSGNTATSVSFVCTDFLDMPFDDVSDYQVHATWYGTGGCAIYNVNKELILGINGSSVSTYGGTDRATLQTITIPHIPNARYIRISGWKTEVSSPSDLWVKGNTLAGAFEHIQKLKEDVTALEANVSTVISQSKVLVIGDSISTDAYGNYKKWVTDLIEEGFFPSDTTNSSQHATGFVARYNNLANDFISRLKAIQNPSQYDLVVVFGGINDYIQNVPMGSETGTDYTVSFKPAVNEFFSYLMENFTQARLCVLLPLRNYQNWQNSVGEYQQSYGEYIKTVAKKYCLPVLNLTEDSGFCPYIATFSEMWTLIPEGYQAGDGVHPNAEYEKRFLAPMIKHFLQGML